MTSERPYRGGICAVHGPVEIDTHARCVLCGGEAALLDSVWRKLARARELDRAHDSALFEDEVRTVIASEAAVVPVRFGFRRRRSA